MQLCEKIRKTLLFDAEEHLIVLSVMVLGKKGREEGITSLSLLSQTPYPRQEFVDVISHER